MPWTKGTAKSFEELIQKIIEWATDAAIHGADVWELARHEAYPRGTILKGHGFKEGEHFYAGLMPLSIAKGSTYRNWFLQKQNLASYFVWSENGLNQPGSDFSHSNGQASFAIQNVSYAFAETPEIFTHSAKVMFMGMFKQYQPDFDWAEQAGGMDFGDYKLRSILYTRSGSDSKSDFYPPVLPGVGYPALSMESYGPEMGYFKYWLTKNRRCLILTMQNGPWWDSAYIGFLEPYDHEEYAFPAVVVGGTSGAISTGIDTYYSSKQRNPTARMGVQFDYRPRSWHFSHGIAPFAGVPTEDEKNFSPVYLMLPDGQWESFYNYVQTLSAVRHHTCNVSSGIPNSYIRNSPKRPSVFNRFIRPGETDLRNFSHVYIDDPEVCEYKLEPLELVQGKAQNTGVLGRLWRMYLPSFQPIRYGEVHINGKTCLMLPNVFEDRKFHLKGRAYDLKEKTDVDALFLEERELTARSKPMQLLIRLED